MIYIESGLGQGARGGSRGGRWGSRAVQVDRRARRGRGDGVAGQRGHRRDVNILILVVVVVVVDDL